MLNFIYRIMMFFSIIALWSYSTVAAAYAAGIGGVAGNLIEPVTILSNFIGTASIVIGVTCLFAAFIKYTQHRVNPVAIPISVVVVLFLVGVVLVSLPYAYKLTESGIPYGLSNQDSLKTNTQ